MQAAVGLDVESNTEELNGQRKTLLQMLFVEGNHFCPSCEKSGHCLLQTTAYEMGMEGPHFEEFYPDRPDDVPPRSARLISPAASCAACACVPAATFMARTSSIGAATASRTDLLVNSETGRLADTGMALTDRAASVCPVGVILPKRGGFVVPIGQRRFDLHAVSVSAGRETP